jgi:hypothetical protein
MFASLGNYMGILSFRHCFISADFVQVILDQGCTIPWCLCTMVSKFCMLESNICWVLIIVHFHVTLLAPRIFGVAKICTPPF